MIQVFLKKQLWKRHGQYLFLVLFLVAFVMGLFYIYFMNFAVLKTAERNLNFKKITVIKREIQVLETQYIKKLDEFDLSYAKSIGFVESEPSGYIYRQKAVAIR